MQALPSLVVAHVLGARPGQRVLDMCAAPGSKAGHIACNFLRDAPGSWLVACERNHAKLAKMHALLRVTFGLHVRSECRGVPRSAAECRGVPRSAAECRGVPRSAAECH